MQLCLYEFTAGIAGSEPGKPIDTCGLELELYNGSETPLLVLTDLTTRQSRPVPAGVRMACLAMLE